MVYVASFSRRIGPRVSFEYTSRKVIGDYPMGIRTKIKVNPTSTLKTNHLLQSSTSTALVRTDGSVRIFGLFSLFGL